MREIKFRAWDKVEKRMFPVAGISWRHVISYGEPERFVQKTIQSIDDASSEKTCWNAPYDPVPFGGYDDNWDEYIKKAKKLEKEHQERMKNIILMQYTGLLDKNGKEIYEGDIVEVLDVGFGYRYMGVINWEQEELQYLLAIHGKYDTMPTGKREIPRTLDYHSFEVIGNIYENPELIK